MRRLKLILAGILALALAIAATAQPGEIVFTYLEGQVVTTIDPSSHTDESSLHAVINMYDPLVYPKVHENSMEPGPHIAESWTISPDGRVYTFNIRRGVRFHDGTELTAEDVLFSFQRKLAIGKGFAWLWGGIIGPDQATVTGPYTIRFTLNQPYAPFLGTFTQLFIVNRRQVTANLQPGPHGAMGDYGEAYLNGNVAGSGPYMLESWDRATLLVMRRFPAYWRGWRPNQITRINYRTIEEEATIRTLLLGGQADMIDQWRTPTTFEALKRSPGIVVDEQPSAQLYFIQMDTQRPPTNDLRVRKALALAFDYDTAVNRIFGGAALARGPVPVTVFGHSPNVQPYRQDLDEARRLLEEAGVRPGQIALDYYFPTGNEPGRQVGLLLQSNVAPLGIRINLRETPWAQIVQASTSAATNPQLASIFDTLKYPHPDSHTFGMYHPSAWGSYRTISRYSNPQVTEILERARATVDRDQQLALYERSQELIAADYPAIFVANPIHRIAFRDHVKGYRYVGLLGYDVAFYDFTIER